MASYLYILGRTPDLAFAELQTFFPHMTRLAPQVASCDGDLPIPPESIMTKLGGTTKIAQLVGRVESVSATTLSSFVAVGVTFGVSVYGDAHVSRSMLEEIKRISHASRFVEAREGKELSSVVVTKEHLEELVVVAVDDGFVVGKTLAVQPFESWSQRDYGRPFADAKSGMLPPKVSRMVVNIADQSRDIAKPLAQKSLCDPFCGMGTILSEALMMGWNVVGSDIDADAVAKAAANLTWVVREHKLPVTPRTMVADAVHVSGYVDPVSLDAIVTEPYMGPTTFTDHTKPQDVKNIIKGLEKLYIGCLRDWHAVLKSGGMVVIAFPSYDIGGHSYTVKKVIDMCEKLGYTSVTDPISYSRPQAVVRRNFYFLRKT